MSSFNAYAPSQERLRDNDDWDEKFRILMQKEVSYSLALKELIKMICSDGIPSNNWSDYIARKIVHNDNDNLGSFKNELEQLLRLGYKFKITMVNKLMNHCIANFDVNLHQLILMKIINPLTKSELDLINESVLKKFVDKRMGSVKIQRMGLSRRSTTNKLA